MAAAFSANRDIKVEASETAAGVYTLRTRGLADRKRPELEIAGVPEVALNGAGGVINLIADYSVKNAEVLADQTVGNVLAVGDDGRKLLLVVRTVAAEQPKGGLWSKLTGGGKGVLRLVDVTGDASAPLTALATMLVHRAAVRRAKDDDEGARTELEAAIATLPGEAGAGEPPSIDGADGAFNWQNHLAYLDLATLAGDDIEAGGGHFGDALVRSSALVRRELGATCDALTALAEGDVTREAQRIVEHNLTHAERGPGPAAGLMTMASPVWELTDGGRAARRASLLPARLLSLYYDGVAAERLLREGPTLAAAILARNREAPWRAAWIARPTRDVWISDEAPLLEPHGHAHPADGVVSTVLADVARCFRAGASNEEILARYVPRPQATPAEAAALTALAGKLAELSTFEGEQYLEAMTL
jgi:hypothetical protein